MGLAAFFVLCWPTGHLTKVCLQTANEGHPGAKFVSIGREAQGVPGDSCVTIAGRQSGIGRARFKDEPRPD